jgi:hypothetical protein
MMSIRFLDETLWAILYFVSGGLLGYRSMRDVLGSVGSVVHEEKLNVVDVADEEGLVAGGGQEAGLLVGAIADLESQVSAPSPSIHPPDKSLFSVRLGEAARTEGMAMVPRKRRRTRLSIPLGLRQLGSTHLNRSLW